MHANGLSGGCHGRVFKGAKAHVRMHAVHLPSFCVCQRVVRRLPRPRLADFWAISARACCPSDRVPWRKRRAHVRRCMVAARACAALATQVASWWQAECHAASAATARRQPSALPVSSKGLSCGCMPFLHEVPGTRVTEWADISASMAGWRRKASSTDGGFVTVAVSGPLAGEIGAPSIMEGGAP